MAETVSTNVSVTPQISLGSADAAAATVEASQNLAAALVKSSQITAQTAASLAGIQRPAAGSKSASSSLFDNPANIGLAGLCVYLILKGF